MPSFPYFITAKYTGNEPGSFPGDHLPANEITLIGDVNGDGKADLVVVKAAVYWQAAAQFVYLSNGTTGFSTVPITSSLPIPSNMAAVSHLADFNGDGKADLAYAVQGASGYDIQIAYSNGQSFEASALRFPYHYWLAYLPSTQVADFDGDGRPDIFVLANLDRAGSAIYLTRPNGFETRNLPLTWQTGLNGCNVIADVTGDGRADIVGCLFTMHSVVTSTDKTLPDLMTSTRNMNGGELRMTYSPSSAFPNFRLPYVLPVVTQLVQDTCPITGTYGTACTTSGTRVVSTTDFGYSGGFYDGGERRFLGFQNVRAVLPDNMDGRSRPVRNYTFRQTLACAGRLELLEYRDGSNATSGGVKLREKREAYADNSTTAPYTCQNTQTEQDEIFANDTRTSRISRTYDAYNNVTRFWSQGDIANAGDDRIKDTFFNPNTSKFIVSSPSAENEYGSGPSYPLMASRATIYDGQGAWTMPPVRGDPTATYRWLQGIGGAETYPTKTFAYDSFGNRTSATDECGNTTTTVYETAYNLLPIRVNNPIQTSSGAATTTCNQVAHQTSGAVLAANQFTTMSYDAVGLLCQKPTATRDIDNLGTTQTYDAFCRPRVTTKPGGAFIDQNYVYEGNPLYNGIVTYKNPPAGITSMYDYIHRDGFGRTWFKGQLLDAAAGNSIGSYMFFTPRGQKRLESAPFLALGANTVYWTSHQYDGLDRKVLTTNPDNSTMTMSYAASSASGGFLSETMRDELGRDTVSHKDAYGKLVQTDRFLGGTGQVGSGTINRMAMTYDELDRLIRITDEPGNVWSAEYDTLSRRIATNDPNHGRWTFTYDPSGRMTSQMDARGRRTDWRYDARGRMRTKTANANQTTTDLTQYFYDESRSVSWFGVANTAMRNGDKLSRQVRAGVTHRTDHDANGHKVKDSFTVDSVTHQTDTAVDTGGRITGRRWPDGGDDGQGCHEPAAAELCPCADGADHSNCGPGADECQLRLHLRYAGPSSLCDEHGQRGADAGVHV
jgi:YD repeat-containing protein